MSVRVWIGLLAVLLSNPSQALGLLEAYDLALRNDPTFRPPSGSAMPARRIV